MRLHEIIDFKPRDTKKSQNDYINRIAQKTPSKLLGVGAFSTVKHFDSPKRLNQVRKFGIPGEIEDDTGDTKLLAEIHEDAYLSYVKMVYDFEMQGIYNPYFPRIHKLKVRRNDEGGLFYDIDMEKLKPYNIFEYNDELLQSIKEHMVDLSKVDDHIKFSPIDRCLRRYLRDSEYDMIVDDNLKFALEKINELRFSNKRFRLDMHEGNIMWRITGTMPQLVITDPLA